MSGPKLNLALAAKMCKLRAEGMKIVDIAERFGVSKTTASLVCGKKSYGPMSAKQRIINRRIEAARLMKSRAPGLSYGEIGAVFGKSHDWAYAACTGAIGKHVPGPRMP